MADSKQNENAEEIRRIFNRFDANGDGKISSSELGDVLRTLGSNSADDISRMMAEVDADNDGFISFQEFSDFYGANEDLMKNIAKIF